MNLSTSVQKMERININYMDFLNPNPIKLILPLFISALTYFVQRPSHVGTYYEIQHGFPLVFLYKGLPNIGIWPQNALFPKSDFNFSNLILDIFFWYLFIFIVSYLFNKSKISKK